MSLSGSVRVGSREGSAGDHRGVKGLGKDQHTAETAEDPAAKIISGMGLNVAKEFLGNLKGNGSDTILRSAFANNFEWLVFNFGMKFETKGEELRGGKMAKAAGKLEGEESGGFFIVGPGTDT